MAQSGRAGLATQKSSSTSGRILFNTLQKLWFQMESWLAHSSPKCQSWIFYLGTSLTIYIWLLMALLVSCRLWLAGWWYGLLIPSSKYASAWHCNKAMARWEPPQFHTQIILFQDAGNVIDSSFASWQLEYTLHAISRIGHDEQLFGCRSGKTVSDSSYLHLSTIS